jgi:hypothetical protein
MFRSDYPNNLPRTQVVNAVETCGELDTYGTKVALRRAGSAASRRLSGGRSRPPQRELCSGASSVLKQVSVNQIIFSPEKERAISMQLRVAAEAISAFGNQSVRASPPRSDSVGHATLSLATGTIFPQLANFTVQRLIRSSLGWCRINDMRSLPMLGRPNAFGN